MFRVFSVLQSGSSTDAFDVSLSDIKNVKIYE